MMSKTILTKIKKAINDYSMIQANDKICLGISGGKDSMLLAYSLAKFRHYSPIPFDIIAVNLNLGFSSQDFSEIEDFFKQEAIEFIVRPSQISDILDKNRNKDGSLKCSLCSKFKKALIIDSARENQCNKVAFAHHGDDAIETLLLNAIYGGKISTFRPKMYMTKTDITFIRPLIYLREREIDSFVKQNRIPVVKSNCPNEGITKRLEIKLLLNKLYQDYPSAYENFQIMLSNSSKYDLWETDSKEDNHEDKPKPKKSRLVL